MRKNNKMQVNLEKLDKVEKMQLKFLMKNGSSLDQNLEVLINNVEGDRSQLSKELIKYMDYKGIEF